MSLKPQIHILKSCIYKPLKRHPVYYFLLIYFAVERKYDLCYLHKITFHPKMKRIRKTVKQLFLQSFYQKALLLKISFCQLCSVVVCKIFVCFCFLPPFSMDLLPVSKFLFLPCSGCCK